LTFCKKKVKIPLSRKKGGDILLILRPAGGNICTVVISPASRKGPYIYLRKTPSQRIIERGFQYFAVRPSLPNRSLTIYFSKEHKEGMARLSLNRSKFVVLPLKYWLSNTELREIIWSQRKGRCSWLHNDVLLINLGLNNSAKPPNILSAKILQTPPLPKVVLIAAQKNAQLSFTELASKILKEKRVRGMRLWIEKSEIIGYIETGCTLACSECSRIDCLPVYPRRESFVVSLGKGLRILAEKLGYNSPEELKQLPLKQRTGEVYLSRGIIVIVFPRLKRG